MSVKVSGRCGSRKRFTWVSYVTNCNTHVEAETAPVLGVMVSALNIVGANRLSIMGMVTYRSRIPPLTATMHSKTIHHSSQILFRLSSAILTLLVIPAQAIKRTVGPADDPRFQNASRACNGSDPKSFEFGTCSILISCVYENLSEALKSSLGSGTSIAALLPTILALIGEYNSSLYPLYRFFSISTISILKVSRMKLVFPCLY